MAREFVYFSARAKTTGNWEDLMKAGRMDIVLNTLIHIFFVSNNFRRDTKLHLVFYGEPDPPKHIELKFDEKTPVSKKDLGGLLKRILFKGQGIDEGKKIKAFPGCSIEKKSFLKVIKEIKKEGKKVFILDSNGKDIRDLGDEDLERAVFVMGDEEGLPKKEYNRLRKNENLLSLGNITYFTSQTAVLIHNEIDRRFGGNIDREKVKNG